MEGNTCLFCTLQRVAYNNKAEDDDNGQRRWRRWMVRVVLGVSLCLYRHLSHTACRSRSGSVRPVLSNPGEIGFRIAGACARRNVSNVRIFFLSGGRKGYILTARIHFPSVLVQLSNGLEEQKYPENLPRGRVPLQYIAIFLTKSSCSL